MLTPVPEGIVVLAKGRKMNERMNRTNANLKGIQKIIADCFRRNSFKQIGQASCIDVP